MDTLGTNLNRVYLNPTLESHPSIFAARSLVLYYHRRYESNSQTTPTGDASIYNHRLQGQRTPLIKSQCDTVDLDTSIYDCGEENLIKKENTSCGLEGGMNSSPSSILCDNSIEHSPHGVNTTSYAGIQSSIPDLSSLAHTSEINRSSKSLNNQPIAGDSVDAIAATRNSGIAFYDLHAHATKRGCLSMATTLVML